LRKSLLTNARRKKKDGLLPHHKPRPGERKKRGKKEPLSGPKRKQPGQKKGKKGKAVQSRSKKKKRKTPRATLRLGEKAPVLQQPNKKKRGREQA